MSLQTLNLSFVPCLDPRTLTLLATQLEDCSIVGPLNSTVLSVHNLSTAEPPTLESYIKLLHPKTDPFLWLGDGIGWLAMTVSPAHSRGKELVTHKPHVGEWRRWVVPHTKSGCYH